MTGKMVPITALQDFPLSDDGFTVKQVKRGDKELCRDPIMPGLKAAGMVVDGHHDIEGLAEGGPAPSLDAPVLMGEQPSETTITGDPPVIVPSPILPLDWRTLHHFKIIKLAKELGGDVKVQADAIAFLEGVEASAKDA